MKKRIFALALVLVMIVALSACSVSGSSSSTSTTTITTSKTDADGNTTTTTVTNETGVSAGSDGIQTTHQTTTTETTTPPSGSMAEIFPPKEEWYDLYVGGGEGTEDGDNFYFAYNNPDDVTEAILLVESEDGEVIVRNGEVIWDEDEECLEIYDADLDVVIPFVFLDTTEEDGVFRIHFLANDREVLFDIVDQDTIINDIYGILARSYSDAAEEDAA